MDPGKENEGTECRGSSTVWEPIHTTLWRGADVPKGFGVTGVAEGDAGKGPENSYHPLVLSSREGPHANWIEIRVQKRRIGQIRGKGTRRQKWILKTAEGGGQAM